MEPSSSIQRARRIRPLVLSEWIVILIVISCAGWFFFRPATVREPSDRIRASSNLRQIGIALHKYHQDNGHFPPAATYDATGKPLLSWRVAILPVIEHPSLYKQFHLDEPWDSPHNINLLDRMPEIYRSIKQPDETSRTYCQLFVGRECVFDKDRKPTLEELVKMDGLSQTIILVEAGEPVPWTKPEDVDYSSDQPIPPLGGIFTEESRWRKTKSGFNVVFADGSMAWITRKFDESMMRAAITRDGKERVDWDLLTRKP